MDVGSLVSNVKKEVRLLTGLLIGMIVLAGCQNKQSEVISQKPLESELLGGSGTVFATTKRAFALPVPHLSSEEQTQFFVGNSFFNRNWVEAPASTTARDGLGPLFNARSCSACHFLDGRGNPFDEEGQPSLALLFRFSVFDSETNQWVNDPHYGEQFNPFAVSGVKPEGKVTVEYEMIEGTFADGTPYELRKPTYQFTELNYGDLSEDVKVSPRSSPAMIGLGLLEAIPEATLLKWADPEDKDQDGISGRVNRVWNEVDQKKMIGRFGWKANQPTVHQQVAGAFLGDIGITTERFQPQENCTAVQTDCQKALSGGFPEIENNLLNQVSFYSRTLAVPAQRNGKTTEVKEGAQLFKQMGCGDCHKSEVRTGDYTLVPALANQTIHPFTDLLLHDMGEGLADHRPDGEATGREWRTAPLWGIGLVSKVNGHTSFLHDGRARNLNEAILWHGGEAKSAQQNYLELNQEQRNHLISFLNSL